MENDWREVDGQGQCDNEACEKEAVKRSEWLHDHFKHSEERDGQFCEEHYVQFLKELST